MSWYAAHIVMMVELKKRKQKHFPSWENVVLIQAASEDAAFRKAEAHGRREEGDDDGSFLWEGERARWVFAGVRKLTACADESRRPGNGSEITFLELEASSRDQVAKYVEGKPVSLKSQDHFAEGDRP